MVIAILQRSEQLYTPLYTPRNCAVCFTAVKRLIQKFLIGYAKLLTVFSASPVTFVTILKIPKVLEWYNYIFVDRDVSL